jgi:hypothetical protein
VDSHAQFHFILAYAEGGFAGFGDDTGGKKTTDLTDGSILNAWAGSNPKACDQPVTLKNKQTSCASKPL